MSAHATPQPRGGKQLHPAIHFKMPRSDSGKPACAFFTQAIAGGDRCDGDAGKPPIWPINSHCRFPHMDILRRDAKGGDYRIR
jgi:hypothetical protein